MLEIRRTFHQQLDDIHADNIRLAAHVTEAIARGTDALLGNDLQAMQQLIDGDDVLDVLSLSIEEQCYHVLALQQPMAGDLRGIISAIRLSSEMERSGDLVVNICKGARRIYPTQIPPVLRGLIEQMAEQAIKLFRFASDAYAERDSSIAAALDDMDDQLDNVHKRYIETLLSTQDRGELQTAVQLALIGRYYERIGDHAVNIGEQVVYMVDGWLPEHNAAVRTEARKMNETPAPSSPEPAAAADGPPIDDG
jgi:phosphate transport system protein